MRTRSAKRQRLRLETLERRELLTVAAEFIGHFFDFSPGIYQVGDMTMLISRPVSENDDTPFGDSVLWRLDGTQPNELATDRGITYIGMQSDDTVVIGDKMFFFPDVMEDGVEYEDMWVTDGTDEGTVNLFRQPGVRVRAQQGSVRP